MKFSAAPFPILLFTANGSDYLLHSIRLCHPRECGKEEAFWMEEITRGGAEMREEEGVYLIKPVNRPH